MWIKCSDFFSSWLPYKRNWTDTIVMIWLLYSAMTIEGNRGNKGHLVNMIILQSKWCQLVYGSYVVILGAEMSLLFNYKLRNDGSDKNFNVTRWERTSCTESKVHTIQPAGHSNPM